MNIVNSSLKERSEHFIQRMKNKFGSKFLYDKVDYVDTFTLVKIFCTIHKDYFTRSPKDLLAAKTSTCPQCKFNTDRSTWEQRGLYDNISYQGPAGYPSFTEYFDGYSWKPIDTYQRGTSIAVFNPETLKVSLEVPLKRIKNKNIKIVSFRTKYSRNTYKPFCIQVSSNNKLLLNRHNSYYTSYVLTKVTRNQKVYIPTVFKTQEIPKDIDDNFFRLLVHLYLTESRIFKLSGHKVNIIINKFRKFEKERLEYLLDINNVSYTIKELKPVHKYSVRYMFNISIKGIQSIDIPQDWFNLSTYYKNILIDELFTYNIIKSYLGVAKRDLKTAHINHKKHFYSIIHCQNQL